MNTSPVSEDDETVVGDETAVIDLHIEVGCRIIGCKSHRADSYRELVHEREFGEVERRQKCAQVIAGRIRTLLPGLFMSPSVDIDVGNQIRQLLEKNR